MGKMLVWASQIGWVNLDRSMVYDKAQSTGANRAQLDMLTDHMDFMFSRLQDESTASMAGVILVDSGYDWHKDASDSDWDDWS